MQDHRAGCSTLEIAANTKCPIFTCTRCAGLLYLQDFLQKACQHLNCQKYKTFSQGKGYFKAALWVEKFNIFLQNSGNQKTNKFQKTFEKKVLSKLQFSIFFPVFNLYVWQWKNCESDVQHPRTGCPSAAVPVYSVECGELSSCVCRTHARARANTHNLRLLLFVLENIQG